MVDAGINVVLQLPPSQLSKARGLVGPVADWSGGQLEKLFFYQKKRVIYVTGPEAQRAARIAAGEASFSEACQVARKPETSD